MTDVNRGGREEDTSWIYPNGHVEGDGSRADHKIRGKRSAKANLLFGWDSLLGVSRSKGHLLVPVWAHPTMVHLVRVMTQQFGQIMQLKAKD